MFGNRTITSDCTGFICANGIGNLFFTRPLLPTCELIPLLNNAILRSRRSNLTLGQFLIMLGLVTFVGAEDTVDCQETVRVVLEQFTGSDDVVIYLANHLMTGLTFRFQPVMISS